MLLAISAVMVKGLVLVESNRQERLARTIFLFFAQYTALFTNEQPPAAKTIQLESKNPSIRP
jgi:hypothetical protein